jgi:uncharacterized protein involved in type VI secretion and phage assembly
MGGYVQQNRQVRVTTPLGESVLLLKAFSGTDEISRPFRFQIEMLAENRKKVPFDGSSAKVTVHLLLPDESADTTSSLRAVSGRSRQEFTVYRAELVPGSSSWRGRPRAGSSSGRTSPP